MRFIILTEPPTISFSKESFKRFLRKILGRKRGPRAVTESLLRGLNELSIHFSLNPKNIADTKDTIILINESIDTVMWACKNLKYSIIIAGPNLYVSPKDNNSFLLNTAIKKVIVPSEWVKKFFISELPLIKEKLLVWPAGVAVPPVITSTKEKIDFVLYVKVKNSGTIVSDIVHILEKKSLTYKVFYYNTFKQSDYFEALLNTRFMIYLSLSESQGIALQEAWARNIPTLVLQNDTYIFKDYYFKDKNLVAPYLTERCGNFFTLRNLEDDLEAFLNKGTSFSPRTEVIEKLSDSITSKTLYNYLITLTSYKTNDSKHSHNKAS